MNIYHLEDYAVGDGVADDAVAVQDAIDAAAVTGGLVLGTRAQIYRCTIAPVVLDHVALDLCGATLRLDLSETNDTGVRLRNYAELRNGRVEVESSGTPSLQAGVHAPVTIGPIYGAGGTVGDESPDEGVTGWAVRGMTLVSDKSVSNGAGANLGAVAIQVTGGANNGIIEQIEVPGNEEMSGGIHLDWGFVGQIVSNDSEGNRERFDEDEAYTTHPHNIVIRDIRIGALTQPVIGPETGSYGVRLSGVYNVVVENVRVVTATNTAFRHTAGDVGFEFAPAAIKPLACQGIEFRDCVVEENSTGQLILSDSYADNVGRAVAEDDYEPLIDPLNPTNIRFERISGRTSAGGSATYGVRVLQQRGGVFEDCVATGYKLGFNVDELAYRVTLVRPTAALSREHGIMVEHGARPPEDVAIETPLSYDNGQDQGFSNPAGIYVGDSLRVRIENAVIGRAGANDPNQTFGIRVNGAAQDIAITGCHVRSAKTGGVAFSLLSGSDYGRIALFADNGFDPGFVSLGYGGVAIVPIMRNIATTGLPCSDFIAQRGTLSSDITPPSGTWRKGDRILFSDPTPGSNFGSICTTAGTIGSGAVFKPLNGVGA